ILFFFFFQAEDGIRDFHVTGVQTCALPISVRVMMPASRDLMARLTYVGTVTRERSITVRAQIPGVVDQLSAVEGEVIQRGALLEIGRASCRERRWRPEVGGAERKNKKAGDE